MATTLEQNQVISSQSMSPVPTIQPVTPTPSTVDPSIASNAIASIIGDFGALSQRQAEAQKEQEGIGQSTLALQNLLSGRTADTQSFENTAGVDTAREQQRQYAEQLANLNAQALSLQREAQAIPIQTEQESMGRGRTEAGVAPLNASRLRENALKSLSLAQQADIASASLTGSTLRLQAAKEKAQQMVDLKYKPIEEMLALKKQQYELNKDTLEQLDKKRAEALSLSIKKEERELAERKDIETMVAEATPNAPTNIISNARKIAEQGGSKLAVAQALGVYGGDYLKNELLREQLKQARVKTSTISSEGRELVTQNGVQLVKVTPKEIQDLNDTQIAKNSLVSLVDNMINSIDKFGTQVLFGTEAGTRSGAKTNLLLAMKNLEKTGALDKGTIDVLSGTIPESEFFATEAAQKAALQQLRDTVVNKTEEYINSYKGTTAETDPRTKRIYEQTGFISTGNPVADDYIRKSMNAIGVVNTSMSTPNAVSAGFIDNQK